ncbi:hypothetical protein CLAIMM_14606 [Cladophialophora immunda]|nr:hypothetical protein CLAIMM_14606 [Cladophialophora immunda]
MPPSEVLGGDVQDHNQDPPQRKRRNTYNDNSGRPEKRSLLSGQRASSTPVEIRTSCNRPLSSSLTEYCRDLPQLSRFYPSPEKEQATSLGLHQPNSISTKRKARLSLEAPESVSPLEQHGDRDPTIKRGAVNQSSSPPTKRRRTRGSTLTDGRAVDWVYHLPETFDKIDSTNTADTLYDQETMSSVGDSSSLMRSESSKSLSTYHADFDTFLRDTYIHDLDPDLKPRGFDDLQRRLTRKDFENDFSDAEWEDKHKIWHRYADKHAGEDSLKAMHYALLPKSSMDLPPPHRWDMDLRWKTFIWKDMQRGFNYKPDYFVGLDPKTLHSRFLEDPELNIYFRPHKAGAVYPHTVAEFKSSFGKHNHAIGQIRYGGAACARTTLLLRRKVLHDQDCFDVPLSTSYTITPEGFRCFVHFCRIVDDEIHYYPAKILNLTMGASWEEFRHNLRQFWRFLQFGQSIREKDLVRLQADSTVNLLTPSLSNGADSESTAQDDREDLAESQQTLKDATDISSVSHKRGLSSPQVEAELRRHHRQYA